jgi:hypothetical protein
MRKHIGFASAAVALAFAIIFFAMSLDTSANTTRLKPAAPQLGSAAGPFFPVRSFEPYW